MIGKNSNNMSYKNKDIFIVIINKVKIGIIEVLKENIHNDNVELNIFLKNKFSSINILVLIKILNIIFLKYKLHKIIFKIYEKNKLMINILNKFKIPYEGYLDFYNQKIFFYSVIYEDYKLCINWRKIFK